MIAATALALAALSTSVNGQGGSISTGARIGRPPASRPSPRPSTPTVARPRGSITTVPIFSGQGRHRPLHFRSSFFGLVAFDPYWWLAPDIGEESVALPGAPPPGPVLLGGLQLDVEPRRAFVYVDGVFVGIVDQYKGYFQHLETSAGYHVVEFFAPDYEPFASGVTVVPNQTTTFRTFLNRANGR